MSIVGEAWSELLEQGRVDERLVHDDVNGARKARLVPLPHGLSPAIKEALGRAQVTHLYAHQADAYEKAFDAPTIVTTGTASGKSLCF
ncbi:MAG: DEAD/DEAH box helicase, partial [Solirubrobacteraceae bacterium]